MQNKYVQILTVAFLIQAGLFYASSRGEITPPARPLNEFPHELSGWTTVKEGYVDDETQAVLKADDTLTRVYGNSKYPGHASLFVAFFKTQRTGKTPHSPKNCLPGSGWERLRDDVISIRIPNLAEPIQVNRYLVSKGDERSLVLYWYQSPKRIIASEYKAKFWTVADAIRYNRTDTSLVRVVVPVRGNDEAAAEQAVAFVQSFFNTLRQYLPA